MDQKIARIVNVEWIAQELQQKFETTGPLIEVVVDIVPKTIQVKKEAYKPSHYLIIQGSFDPPTSSHINLISKAIYLHSKLYASNKIKVLLLLSLSHVDKRIDVLNRSLLGYRVEMLENLYSSLKIKTPISIGLSNVARYIDLIDAIRQFFPKIEKLSFVMGMDVFKKLLDASYYSKPVEEVLHLIFRANYYIAGRRDVFSKKEFDTFLNKHLHQKYHQYVHFLSLSKSYRFLNATSIREKYSNDQPIQELYTHSTIIKYLKKNNIYRLTPKWIATKIAIHLVVQLTLESGKDQIIAIKILRQLLPEIERKPDLQQQLINDYKSKKTEEISKRWNQLINLIS
ncbi:MAG: hypothetical protein JSW11_11145 [Candidatus Heimdallarchaeota archaeon]|nr:MAG: hypothetical protein JSW11_11145 [Candidatus Heimdallarchaeota archaeon]